jgi:hypothetical protein
MSAERFERVNQLVHTIFGPRFHIKMFDIPEDNTYYSYEIKYPDKKKTSCLAFYFEDEFSHLHISWLSKCGPADDLRSGTLLLNMVDALAGLIPECKTMTLEDESTVRRCSYSIDLAELAILLTGISWYNQFGYKQQSYESDKEHNDRVINMPIGDAVPELLASPEIKKHYPKFLKYKQELDTRLKLGNSSDLTVSKYVQILYDFIKPYPEYKDQCIERKERNVKLVTYVITAFGRLLTYNEIASGVRSVSVLTKQVVHRKYIPPFINPSTMTAFEFEPEDIFNCGDCGRVLRGDDLPPWNAEPKGVKYYATRGEDEDEVLICHKCAAEEAAMSPRAAKSPRAAMSPKASSAPGGGARKSRRTMRKPMCRKPMRRKPMRRTRRITRRKQMI